ncbi:Protein-tyrosine phosphatase, receptor/non-receptor type domain and Protein-tyrosine/Dual specificity phosphatase domain and Protein-tyrosine phosphatase, catalytic domain-containing protein [Strongyloides ratti]|uniref:Protein-tyrosine phosphatase, receptor/non-receptor type domain and Protein-tyrosine/Dual specificity phosphatase domain and Protein-tyrosine phosphatase, catalytic domain-containing protein n=1 Tax=Strongyloides ratti TaxID=34506 RepID=A0A090L6I3_STRRB|nr:Protein-tyrosine phosphatase, receptor/non-receptor type domain and Protein-tyrosine/Dual specificity phosphatase domain and Protein-tyrosine phosphatase, catalytic domain-containing protein [Strongyloides ratti]CEF65411.1 Protein-tyrosine phosphatase, receptor/non-receptor type domain and Protein-tyrosine/Dual specificity phosphatase domain and Protein-tyrosine phosphatase, catalytic domain-containing protein [Strongyloides ratti]
MSFEGLYAVDWCYEILNHGVYSLASDYCTFLKNQINNEATFENFNDSQNKEKIRYNDVKMNDQFRVKIKKEGNSTDFIHANYISTPFMKDKFIATQGPLLTTRKDFWKMIIENNVETIVMLCGKITFNNITIKCLEIGPISDKCKEVTKTFLEINYENKNEFMIHFICHYSWTNWPDRSVPKDIKPLILILDSVRHHTTPIVVHCSAGIGRTGCLIAIEHYLEKVISNKKLDNGISYINFLRTMRQHAIQTEKQYVFIHYCILKVVIGNFKDLLSTDVKELFEKFEKDYETFI